LGDLDGDRDLDVVAGDRDGTLRLLEQEGRGSGVFRERLTHPFQDVDVGEASTPALGDLDGDGDLDLLVGELAHEIHYYEQVAGSFVERTGVANPFRSVTFGTFEAPRTYSHPVLEDLDGDGDLDLLLGSHFGVVRMDQLGSRSGVFEDWPGTVVANGSRSAPGVGDLDGDDDPDLLIGDFDGTLRYFEIGSEDGQVVQHTGSANPFGAFDAGGFSTAVIADLDADGHDDVIAGGRTDSFYTGLLMMFFRRVAPGTFEPARGIDNPFGVYPGTTGGLPALCDLDHDGDLDALLGARDGVLVFEHFGHRSGTFQPRPRSFNPFELVDAGVANSPGAGDLDGDGDCDVVIVGLFRAIHVFEHVGVGSGSFRRLPDEENPLGFAATTSTDLVQAAIGDLDEDGDADVVAVGVFGLRLFEQTGVWSGSFVERTGANNPFSGIPFVPIRSVAVGDLDQDGDNDVVFTTGGHGVLRNLDGEGFAFDPTPVAFGPEIHAFTAPALGDVDADGDVDVVTSYGSYLVFHEAFDPLDEVVATEAPVLGAFAFVAFMTMLAAAGLLLVRRPQAW
jgi:hypothetical protein